MPQSPENFAKLTPIERMAHLDPPRTLLELKKIFLQQTRNEVGEEKLAHVLDEFIRDAIYNERNRLKGDKHASAEEKAYWKDVNARIDDASAQDLQELACEIVAHFGKEIHGYFSPMVYQAATQVLPRFFGVVLNTLSPMALLDKTMRLASDIVDPEINSLKSLLEQIPDIDTQLQFQGELDTLRDLEKKGTIILVPTHVSNMDSPLIGWSIYKLGLPPFTYGAGLNLFTNPFLGFFMRNLGAYTVDRKKHSALYKEALKAYSTYVLTQGMHSIFFPGGTRSRSGAIEDHLKLGLLGTGLDAYIHNLQHKKDKPNIYIVPCVFSYQIVLEAETLIAEFLKGMGKARYGIVDDESTQFEKIRKFLRSLTRMDAKIFLTVSRPIDPFGNAVDDDGNSIDAKGRVIDIRRYVMEDGYVVRNPPRDRQYTQELGQAIAAAYRRDNMLLMPNIVCFSLFQQMRASRPEIDLFRMMRLAWSETPLDLHQVIERLDRFLLRLFKTAGEGRIRVSEKARRSTAREMVSYAENVLSSYHDPPPFEIRDGKVYPLKPELIYYYGNRADGYGFESSFRSKSTPGSQR